MKCSHVHIGGQPAILCGGRRYDLKKCDCGAPATKLCDWIIKRSTMPALPTPITCDHPICDAHAFAVDKNKDLCPAHRDAWAAHPKNPKNQGD